MHTSIITPDNLSSNTLALPVVNNTPIRMNDAEQLSLNDLWIAAGKPSDRNPGAWLKRKQVSQVIDLYARADSPSQCNQPLTTISTGANVGSWAIEPLAIKYSQWISPQFEVDCLSVLTAFSHGKLQPKPLTPAELMVHQAQMLVDQERRLSNHDKQIEEVKDQINHITSGAPCGWFVVTRIGEHYGFTKQKAKELVAAYELKTKPVSIGEYGTITQTVLKEDFMQALGEELKSVKLLGKWFVSQKIGRFAAKGIFLKQYNEKVLLGSGVL